MILPFLPEGSYAILINYMLHPEEPARHGECLQGVWQHGKPIGPFRASEYCSDYRFTNVRLAFAQLVSADKAQRHVTHLPHPPAKLVKARLRSMSVYEYIN